MKKVLIGIIMCLGILSVKAQENSFGVSSGIVNGGIGYQFYFNKYNKNVVAPKYLQVGLMNSSSNLTNTQQYSIEMESFTVSLGHFHHLGIFKENNRKVAWSVGYGAFGGLDIIEASNSSFINGAILTGDGKAFTFGPFVSMEFEFYISQTASIFLRANQYFKLNDSINSYPFLVGLGVQIFL